MSGAARRQPAYARRGVVPLSTRSGRRRQRRRALRACEGALVLDLLEGAQEERLVDATLKDRYTELHALRDDLAPVHASFSSELGGRQVDRHTVLSSVGADELSPVSFSGCAGRRKPEFANCALQEADFGRKTAPLRRSDRVRDLDEAMLDAEALLQKLAEPAHAERLGGVVAGRHEGDAGLAR